MKNKRLFRVSLMAIIGLTLMMWVSTSLAKETDCWAEFFDEAQYAGKHFLLQGPAKLENLNAVDGENWDGRVHSIKIGAKAQVTVYQNPKFELSMTDMAKKPDFMHAWGITEQDIKEDSELMFTGEEQIHDLGDFNFHKKVRSLKVDCLP